MNTLFKEFVKACIVGVSIYIVFILIHLGQGNRLVLNHDLVHDFLTSMIYSIVLYLVNMGVFRYFFTRYFDRLFTRKILSRAIASSVVVTVIATFLIRFFLNEARNEVSFTEFVASETLLDYLNPAAVALVVNAVFYTFYYYKYNKDKQVKEQKIIAGAASAQFDALKNQLDPHFLFNSLNVLTSLIEENPAQAQKFTTSLSKVYRYVLEQKNKELVSLSEEMAFAKTYMSLLKMRYEESIVFSMPEHLTNPDAKVVPLALQLLLENAVKHNVVSDKHKLYITLEEEQGYLIVKNNLQPKKVMNTGSGVGLINIKQRYALLTSRTVYIKQTETEFKIGIPILTRQLKPTIMNTKEYLADKKYALAKEQVEKLKGFYIHLTVYCVVITAMAVLNITTSSFPWVLFPALGWGLGLFFHAADVFQWNPFLGKNWEARKIDELMKEQNDNK